MMTLNISFQRAMINELTHKEGERVALNSFRYAWTVIANIFVYGMAIILLGSHSGDKNDISPSDAPIFRTLTFIVIGFGFFCMIIFHVGTKESDLPAEETEERLQLSISSSGRLKRMTWKSFLREKQFYQCALIWMFTRVILNVTQVNIFPHFDEHLQSFIFLLGLLATLHYRHDFCTRSSICCHRSFMFLCQRFIGIVSHASNQQKIRKKSDNDFRFTFRSGKFSSILVHLSN